MKKKSQFVLYDDLNQFANQYITSLQSGDVVGLSGVIGAGKTTFLRVLLQQLGMDVDAGFTSPTFTIVNRYDLPQYTIHHVDLYRLETMADLEQIDLFPDFGQKGSLTFIEWADKFPGVESILTKKIHFEYCDEDPLKRKIITYGN